MSNWGPSVASLCLLCDSSVKRFPKALNLLHNIYLWNSPAKILEVYKDSYSTEKHKDKNKKIVWKLTPHKNINDK